LKNKRSMREKEKESEKKQIKAGEFRRRVSRGVES
jgi:hypothetical protein